MFTKNRCIEYGQCGILFISLCPGEVLTDMMQTYLAHNPKPRSIMRNTVEASTAIIEV